MIAVIDYGMGNLGSIVNMFGRLGVEVALVSTPEDVAVADAVILPGVGAFDRGMSELDARQLRAPLTERVDAGVPVLGICLGMQLLARNSEEGQLPGLGWIDATVVRFHLDGSTQRVPHMGWNEVRWRPDAALSDPMMANRYYFVHSYHVECANDADVLGVANHGYEFAAAIGHANVVGVQFHPEKSHRFGLEFLRRWLERVPANAR